MIDLRETPYYNELSILRKEYLEKLLSWKDKNVIKVITGIRRCGKSIVLRDFCKEISKSVAETQITFFNFEMLENEELKDYHLLYTTIKNRLQADKMNYIFLDEIQEVQNFEKVVDSLFVMPNVDIYLTGSNANMLSSEIATLLSGRYIEINILPFSFSEFQLGYKSKFPNHNLDIPSLYTKYITYGGFPYLHKIYEENEIIKDYLQGLYSIIVLTFYFSFCFPSTPCRLALYGRSGLYISFLVISFSACAIKDCFVPSLTFRHNGGIVEFRPCSDC